MSGKWRNGLPLCSANERKSAETIGSSIGCDTLSPKSLINPESGVHRVLEEAEIQNDCDRRSCIIEDDENPVFNDESD